MKGITRAKWLIIGKVYWRAICCRYRYFIVGRSWTAKGIIDIRSSVIGLNIARHSARSVYVS